MGRGGFTEQQLEADPQFQPTLLDPVWIWSGVQPSKIILDHEVAVTNDQQEQKKCARERIGDRLRTPVAGRS